MYGIWCHDISVTLSYHEERGKRKEKKVKCMRMGRVKAFRGKEDRGKGSSIQREKGIGQLKVGWGEGTTGRSRIRPGCQRGLKFVSRLPLLLIVTQKQRRGDARPPWEFTRERGRETRLCNCHLTSRQQFLFRNKATVFDQRHCFFGRTFADAWNDNFNR